jgi:hypothetical protein
MIRLARLMRKAGGSIMKARRIRDNVHWIGAIH